MKNRLLTLGLHFALFFALAYGYEYHLSVLYGYEGYSYNPDSLYWYIGLASVALLSLCTPIASEKPSTLFYQLILAFILIPMTVLFYAESQPLEYFSQVLVAYLVAVYLPRFVRIVPPEFSRLSKGGLRRILFWTAAIYIVAIFAMGGGAYLNFDLSKVYDFRTEAAENLPGVFGYISPLVGKVVVPIAFVLSLLHKRYVTALAFLVISFLIFGLTAHKAILFDPFFILFVYVVSSGKNLTHKFNIAALVAAVLSIADFHMWEARGYEEGVYGWMGSMVLERTFFLPAQLNFMYYDFFSRNPFVLFADSKLSLGLLQYPYPLDVPHLIGREYFHNDRTGANTGWFGSGYMQAGFFGLLLYGAIIGLVFRYIDACARKSGEPALVTAAMVVHAFVLVTSSDLPTTFLTHGLWVSLLLIACFRKTDPVLPVPQRPAAMAPAQAGVALKP